MSKEKFTPGPWPKPVYNNDVGPFDDYFVQWWEIEGICKVDTEVDSYLIATAPELYTILDQVATDIEAQGVLIEWHQVILDILAKSRGEHE
jgi:hypothetical protein